MKRIFMNWTKQKTNTGKCKFMLIFQYTLMIALSLQGHKAEVNN